MVRYNDGDENPAEKQLRSVIRGVILAGVALIVVIAVFSSFYTVQSGQEGVLLTFNKADPVAKEPGLHAKIPFVQKVVKFDVRTQKFGVDNTEGTLESAASSDLQVVKVRLAVNYHLVPGKTPEIFKNVGPSYEDTVILPTLHESTKASVAQFNAADLINKREEVRTEVENLLKAKLQPYNIIVEQVSITDFDFSEQFNVAIENKVTAEQQALKAQRDLERIKIEAEQRIADAEGQRQAAIAQAQGEAEKVKLVQQQLMQSPQYIEYIRAQRWDGRYPLFYMTGSGSAPNLLMQVPMVNATFS
jgi:prohibitin 2